MDKQFIYNTGLNIDSNCSEFFIYGFGLAGKWLSDNIDKKVTAFIDTDQKKTGRSYNGIKVLSVEEAAEVLNQNSEIIVTVNDIKDIMPIIEKLPKKEWTALGLKLDKTKVINNQTGEKDSFIEYTLQAVEDCHKAYFDKIY